MWRRKLNEQTQKTNYLPGVTRTILGTTLVLETVDKLVEVITIMVEIKVNTEEDIEEDTEAVTLMASPIPTEEDMVDTETIAAGI